MLRSFNDALVALAEAVRATANSPAAAWGLPAPETCTTLAAAAPACWHPATVAASAHALMQARVPMYVADQVQGVRPGDMRAAVHAAAGLLHHHYAQWVDSRACGTVRGSGGSSNGGSAVASCLLLPHLVPRVPSAASQLLPAMGTPGPQAPSSPQHFALTSFLARSPGGFPFPASPASGVGALPGNGYRQGASYAQAVAGARDTAREPVTPGWAQQAAFGGAPVATPVPPYPQLPSSPWLQPAGTSQPAMMSQLAVVSQPPVLAQVSDGGMRAGLAAGSVHESAFGVSPPGVGFMGSRGSVADPAVAADAWEAKNRAHAVLGDLLQLISGGTGGH